MSDFEILHEMDKFLEICQLPKLTQKQKTCMGYNYKVKFSVNKVLSPDRYTGKFYQRLRRQYSNLIFSNFDILLENRKKGFPTLKRLSQP